MSDANITLGGDISPLGPLLQRAQGMFKDFASQAGGVVGAVFTTAIAGLEKMGGLIGKIANMFASQLKIPRDFGEFLSYLNEGFSTLSDSERSLARIEAAIVSTGGAAGFSAKQVEALAHNMSALSTHTKESAQQAAGAVLQFRNVRGDIFKEALEQAVDFAAATGVDLPSAAEKLGRALDDPIIGLRTLRSEGVKFTIQQREQMDILIAAGDVVGAQRMLLDQLAMSFKGSASREADTFSGRIMQMNNVIEQSWKAIAKSLTPALIKLIPFVEGAGRIVEWAASEFEGWMSGITVNSDQAFQVLIDWLKYFLDQGVYAFTAVQTAIQSWSNLTEAASLKFQLAMIGAFDYILDNAETWMSNMYTLLTEAPGKALQAYVDVHVWAFNQVIEAIKSSATYFGDTLMNMYDNAVNFGKNLWKALKGQDVDWSWKGMEKGFEISLDEMSKAAGFSSGLEGVFEAFEQKKADLKNRLSNVQNEFNSDFATNLAANTATVEGALSRLNQTAQKSLKQIGNANLSGQEFLLEGAGAGRSGTQGAFEDLFSLQKRIQSAAFKTPEERAIEEQTKKQQQQAAQAQQTASDQLKTQREQVAATNTVANLISGLKLEGGMEARAS